ncbi:MAG: hypothetical protein WBO34_15370 [Gammaproteobacteria bacterium]
MRIRNLIAGVATLMVVACASITEVVPAGKDTYVVAGDDSLEGISGASIKTGLYKKANTHCELMGKKLLPLNESVSAYTAELRFRCLEEDDPEYVRPIMESVPDVKIETK